MVALNLKAVPTSLANLCSKSVSMAIASSVASSVPNAGISLVLLDPRVGYLETAETIWINREATTSKMAWGREYKRVWGRAIRWL